MQLFENQIIDGSSAWTPAVPDAYNGLINIYVVGDLGGGTLRLEALAPDGLTAVPVSEGSFTGAGVKTISAASFTARVTLTGATAADVSVWLEVESVMLRALVWKRA